MTLCLDTVPISGRCFLLSAKHMKKECRSGVSDLCAGTHTHTHILSHSPALQLNSISVPDLYEPSVEITWLQLLGQLVPSLAMNNRVNAIDTVMKEKGNIS
jgi:hypothetical protein